MGFKLNNKAYFENHGVNVMAFDDKYPAGHQSGISVIMNGRRIATNGDLRFEQTPGQWQPVPKQDDRKVDQEGNSITTTLSYPDINAHLNGFNPIIYPDFEFSYEVVARGLEDGVEIVVSLDRPVPQEFLGKLCFNLELYPGDLFGKPWMMDDATGIFPRQANGPTKAQPANYDHSNKIKPLPHALANKEKLAGYNKGYNPIIADDLIGAPMAVGHSFTLRPDNSLYRMTIISETAELRLYDGRMNHNNGWFAVSSEIPANTEKEAIKWIIKPYVDTSWMYTPVIQTSQVGYHPCQPKKAVIELDERDKNRFPVSLEKLTPTGYKEVKKIQPEEWGIFLRYQYLICDFSDVTEEGMYRICYGEQVSSDFGIGSGIYDVGVWQPVVEYFLPVQMCHMRVNEKYRVWHGLCHCDDARMAPVNYNHFD
ncbi:MAG: hypothetical protein MJ124_07480, partial [Lachnospiraceae bacterium]|nr:hypothetical protein [Lachnospiraceae bacterium]